MALEFILQVSDVKLCLQAFNYQEVFVLLGESICSPFPHSIFYDRWFTLLCIYCCLSANLELCPFCSAEDLIFRCLGDLMFRPIDWASLIFGLTIAKFCLSLISHCKATLLPGEVEGAPPPTTISVCSGLVLKRENCCLESDLILITLWRCCMTMRELRS